MIGLALATGAAALFAAAVGIYAHRAVVPRRRGRREAELKGLGRMEVEFEARDGTPLRGWLLPAGNPRADYPHAGTLPPPAARAVVLLCHGYRGDRASMAPHARFLREHGYATLLFDFRAAGESEGDVCSFGYHEANDVLGALDFLAARQETTGLPAAGLGLSMGAVALILAAAEAPTLRAIVAEGMYPSLAQAIERRCRLMFGPAAGLVHPIIQHVVQRRTGVHPADVRPLEVASRLPDRPILFIHNDQDLYIDVEHAEEFLRRSPEPKALWRAADARHCRAMDTDPEGYQRRVLDFLAAHGL